MLKTVSEGQLDISITRNYFPFFPVNAFLEVFYKIAIYIKSQKANINIKSNIKGLIKCNFDNLLSNSKRLAKTC